MRFIVRQATVNDAEGVANVLNPIVEGKYVDEILIEKFL